jgi:hypothetical protein
MDIEQVKELLRNNVITVNFRKKDGTIRQMLCTTMSEYLPEFNGTSTTSSSFDNILTVWDLEKNAWRSFKYDSIQSIYVDELCG